MENNFTIFIVLQEVVDNNHHKFYKNILKNKTLGERDYPHSIDEDVEAHMC